MLPILRSCVSVASKSPACSGKILTRSITTTSSRLNEESFNARESYSRNDTMPRRRGPSLNRVELIGNLARDPMDKATKTGTKFVTFSMFTNVEFRRADGSFGEHAELHEIHAFGGLANYVLNNLHKGSKALVVGRLHYLGGQLRPDGLKSPKFATISAEVVQPIMGRKQEHDTSREHDENEEA